MILCRDANRLTQRQTHRVIGDRQHVAANFRRQAAVVLETGRHVLDIEFRFDDGFAAVTCFELRQLGRAFAHDPRESEQDASPILRRGVLPRAMVERVTRRPDRAIDIGRTGIRHTGKDLACRRVDHVQRRR